MDGAPLNLRRVGQILAILCAVMVLGQGALGQVEREEEEGVALFRREPLDTLGKGGMGAGGKQAPVVIPMSGLPTELKALPKVNKPLGAGRLVSVFDFQEPENPEDVPLNWFRAQHNPPTRVRTGFPSWNRGGFDRSVGFVRAGANRSSVAGGDAGEPASVRLSTQGGSASLKLADGVLRVFPDAEYRVAAMIKTEGLTHARAGVKVVAVDAQGREISGTATYSAMVGAESGELKGGWRQVLLTVRKLPANASSLVMELLLLQPEELIDELGPVAGGLGIGGELSIRSQDTSGSAWFDDLVIVQLPRVRLSPTEPAGVFAGSSKPTLSVQVRDLTGEELIARMDVRDSTGRLVSNEQVQILHGTLPTMWTPKLPKFGWYNISMSLVGVDSLSADVGVLTEASVLWVGQTERGESARSSAMPFGVVQDNSAELGIDGAMAIDRALMTVGLQSISAAAPYGPRETEADRVTFRTPHVALGLHSLPRALGDLLAINQNEPMALSGFSLDQWTIPLRDSFAIDPVRASKWVVGSFHEPFLANDSAALAGILKLRTGIGRLSANPRLSVSWRADTEFIDIGSAQGPLPFQGVHVLYPSSFQASVARDAVKNFASLRNKGLELTWVVEQSAPGMYSMQGQSDESLIKLIELWAATQPASPSSVRDKLTVYNPMKAVVTGNNVNTIVRAGPILAGISTLAKQTAGMKLIGELPTEPGVRSLILAPEDGSSAIGSLGIGSGVMIAYHEHGDGAEGFVDGYFGGGVLRLTDPFGNVRELKPNERTGKHRFAVTSTPVFIDGIDANLVSFLSDAAIRPEFVPAVIASHDCEVILRNPWKTRISGQVQVLPPASSLSGKITERTWQIQPAVPTAFSIAPGGIVRIPFNFLFGPHEDSGRKDLQLAIRLTADRSYPVMRIVKPITVGLEDLDLQVSATLGPSPEGPDVIVTAVVANAGSQPRTLQVATQAQGFAIQTQPIVDLAPGESGIRRFVYRDAAKTLSGNRVRVLMVDVDGSERLNKFAQVP